MSNYLTIYVGFALIAEAADGDTKKQLMDVFKFPTDYLNQFSDIIHSIDQSEATIKIANSFWLNDKFKLDKEFMTKILQIFKDAEGSECNFNSEEQRAKWVLKINSWVRQKTTGHIQKIIQHIDSGSTLLLVRNSNTTKTSIHHYI
jgi:serine protease inhibitor